MSALSLRWGGIRALPGMGIRCCMMCHGSGPDSPSINRRLRQYSSDLKPTLSFEEYRGRKKTLKLRTRIAGLPMAVVGSALSGSVSIYLNPRMFEMTPEDVQSHLILGMDPIMLSVLSGLVSAVAGYVMGGAIFMATWKLIARSSYQELKQRDEDFLERLQKHRFTEGTKYEDDYYGDRIKTLSDYRQWIRQQQKRKEAFQAEDAARKK